MLFKTIYADPPWQYNDKLDDSRKKPYNTLTINDLCNLDIKNITHKEAHLYLWVAHSFLKESFKIIESWDFDYKIPIHWLKRTKNGKIWFGMGHYFRSSLETCLFCTKGNLRLKTKNTRNFLDAKKPNKHHSSKPIEMYDLIENNSYHPYLELFATEKRENWISYGYEIDNKDIKDHIKELNKQQKQTKLENFF